MKRRKVEINPNSPAVEKWLGAEVLNEGFLFFPKRLLRTVRKILRGPKQLNDLCVLLAIVDYFRNHPDHRPPSIKILSRIAGLSQDEVRDRLDDLEKQDLIEIKSRSEHFVDVDYSRFVDRIIEASDEQGVEEKDVAEF